MLLITYRETTKPNSQKYPLDADCGYGFLFERYLPVLEKLGSVVIVDDPASDIDKILAENPSKQCVFLSFTPPHLTSKHSRCPTVCVFGWAFSSIPDGSRESHEQSDWRADLLTIGNAITLSTYSADIVSKTVMESVNVAAIPAPLATTAELHSMGKTLTSSVSLNADFYDSRDLVPSDGDAGNDTFSVDAPTNLPRWDGSTLKLSFAESNTEGTKLLMGFYAAENWGVWSRTTAPQVYLPAAIAGPIVIEMELVGYGENVGRSIHVDIGDFATEIVLTAEPKVYEVRFDARYRDKAIHFSNLDLASAPGRDYRTLGVGMKTLTIKRPEGYRKPVFLRIREQLQNAVGVALGGRRNREAGTGRELELSGAVYTSVFDPDDGRKNWEDMVTAFCWAFRDQQDATLILKMNNTNVTTFLGTLKLLFSTLPVFKCRVVAVHGRLSDAELRAIQEATHFVVNSSLGEGECLPLMEFMAQGVPAISPNHTAMADYINEDNAFVVSSSLQPGFWPFDERKSLGTLLHRIDWMSLKAAFEDSYSLVMNNSDSYERMRVHSLASMSEFASQEAVYQELHRYLQVVVSKN